MSETRHTPLPWDYGLSQIGGPGSEHRFAIFGEERDEPVVIFPRDDEDAEGNRNLIVLAVNAHAALASSLERCAFLLEKIADGDHRALQSSLDAAEEARAALALIEEGKP